MLTNSLRKAHQSILVMFVLFLMIACIPPGIFAQNTKTIRLATTTSLAQSGFLDYMLPFFEKSAGYRVQVIAAGTGAALKTAENGDCDLVMVHARNLEDAFMAKGFGSVRFDYLSSEFIMLGPRNDPAKVEQAVSASDAFLRIAARKALFISRADNSGTHQKELELWGSAKIKPAGYWYREAGLGMAEALNLANQLDAYILADKPTWLAVRKVVPELKLLYQGDSILRNDYSIIVVNKARWPHVNSSGAQALAEFLLGRQGGQLAQTFMIDGEPCFFLTSAGKSK